MPDQSGSQWTEFYAKSGMMYPDQEVVRIFKGRYPRLSMPPIEPGQTALDLGCGDGRHLAFLRSLGARVTGCEINEEIVSAATARMKRMEIEAVIYVGLNHDIPEFDASFDYLLSWNACYYMGQTLTRTFDFHVAEIARVINPGGWLVCSVPMASSFIFEDAEELAPGYMRITSDPFGLRNGEILRCFANEEDIHSSFRQCFDDFSFASVRTDMFGYAYHWHLFTAKRGNL